MNKRLFYTSKQGSVSDFKTKRSLLRDLFVLKSSGIYPFGFGLKPNTFTLNFPSTAILS